MKMNARSFIFLALILVAGVTGPADAQQPQGLKIVATIAPVHSLVASITSGVVEPVLLMPGGSSPHSFALKPSDATALQRADVVVRVGETLESFLERPLTALGQQAQIVSLDEIEGIKLHAARQGGVWDEHDEAHDHADHHHGADAHNPHIWLDPQNAIIAVDHIVEVVSKSDPANAKTYRDNAAALKDRLRALDDGLKTKTAPVAGAPYVVFHDAYIYFEKRYDLNPAGAVTLSPDRAPGARRLSELRSKIAELDAVCVFSEPQFEPKLVETITSGTSAQNAVLDPLGASIEPGPNHYFTLMTNLAQTLADCLSNKS
jgi:zinc transport system substrate-binding protein